MSNGFTVPPLRLMHCDTLEVFLGRSKSANLAERRQSAGLGLLMRTAVFAYGLACGCEKAEILAINDDGSCTFDRSLRANVCAFMFMLLRLICAPMPRGLVVRPVTGDCPRPGCAYIACGSSLASMLLLNSSPR